MILQIVVGVVFFIIICMLLGVIFCGILQMFNTLLFLANGSQTIPPSEFIKAMKDKDPLIIQFVHAGIGTVLSVVVLFGMWFGYIYWICF